MQHYVTLKAGLVYAHCSNGSQYLCLSSTGHDAKLERLGDKWTFTAHGVQISPMGGIHWNYSTGGRWPTGCPENFISERI